MQLVRKFKINTSYKFSSYVYTIPCFSGGINYEFGRILTNVPC